MSIDTLRSLFAAGIGLVLAQGARAADPAAPATGDGTQAVAQAVASNRDGSSAQAAGPDNNAQTAISATQGDGTRATGSCDAPSTDCVAVGHWNFDVSLGAGVRTDPVVHEADIPLVVIPHFSYYGKRVFIEDLDLGITLTEDDANSLSLIASPGYDRVFFYRSDLQNIFVSGVPSAFEALPPPQTERFPARPRHWTYLAGPEWTFKTHGITGQLDFLHEITAQNHGNEVRAALGIPLIESAGSLSANVGLTWKSAAIVNYYYGAPGVYEGGSALNPFIKLGYSRPLSSKWRLTAFVHCEHLGNSIADSPIVNAHYVVTVFAGANYAF
jgi:MipA family protein